MHVGAAVTRRVAAPAEAAAMMARLRADPPDTLAGFAVATTDLAPATDALVFTGEHRTGTAVRVVLRPSGTEPKVKFYMFTYVPPGKIHNLAATKKQLTARRRRADDNPTMGAGSRPLSGRATRRAPRRPSGSVFQAGGTYSWRPRRAGY